MCLTSEAGKATDEVGSQGDRSLYEVEVSRTGDLACVRHGFRVLMSMEMGMIKDKALIRRKKSRGLWRAKWLAG
jgi:hypothetical protein